MSWNKARTIAAAALAAALAAACGGGGGAAQSGSGLSVAFKPKQVNNPYFQFDF